MYMYVVFAHTCIYMSLYTHTSMYIYVIVLGRYALMFTAPLPLCWKASFLRTGPRPTAVASVPTTVPGTEELFYRELLNECTE